ncbi:DNA adenine methylase [Agromyces flavus]|uniref:site-specific DNA-methyltransferase (adenine-specific) n=1 Tax=Agromyces flavus TaxID=589382 RepID=A0A1H1W2I1_9MICO|nr:DNA adenine methylase [Agromyces flavus]MCP2366071.1 DNA adenine methylase [Agromyces flavus]GGI43941.1 site-specific DNA-methyltransferase (adenine-specific) [Agromyces flavus]SDS91327.1 DNA adenine methylase [Agromyces flavus]
MTASTDTAVDLAERARSVAAERIPPFLRWAGGKRWLVPQILRLTSGIEVKRYHEPFVGGGSVFFALPRLEEAVLSDLNTDLIEVYREVRDHPMDIHDRLERYENTRDHYYAARAASPVDAIDRAARFIYLNHTSFNGIFRVNLRGEYNVPFGNRKSVNIPDRAALRAASERLKGARLNAADFERALGDVREGDLVFLDPPYTVAHNNNGFVKYNQHLFSFDDQRRLAESVRTLVEIGARYILTNAAHHSIDELFSTHGRRLTVSRRNVIAGKAAARGSAEEYLFTNIEEL